MAAAVAIGVEEILSKGGAHTGTKKLLIINKTNAIFRNFSKHHTAEEQPLKRGLKPILIPINL